MLYFDHAATSFPKAPGVAEEAARFLREDAGNAGRGAHGLASLAQDAIERTRVALAALLGAPDARRVALVTGATEALNVALAGLVRPGRRVLVGPDAHNSVLRPLRALARERAAAVEEVATDDVLRWDLADLAARLDAGGAGRGPAPLVVVTHGSNVTGAVQDLAAVTALARARGATVVVDAAQTAGALPLDVAALGVDVLACSGHKGLLGPTGTGALYVRAGLELAPLLRGGTGTSSDDEDGDPTFPTALEPGTRDAFALAALGVALRFVRERTPQDIHARAAALGVRLRSGLAALPGVRLHAAAAPGDLPIVSFTVAGWDPAELAALLDAAAGVCVRAGLHCAPRAHRRIGTAPAGTLRASVGPFVDDEDLDVLLATLSAVL